MDHEQQEILDFIRQKSDHPMKPKELARALGISRPDYHRFRQLIKQLLHSGDLVKLKRGRLGLASEMNVKVGQISITRGGTGFLIVEDSEDILIPPTQLSTAFDGDTVMVRLGGFSAERQTGTVIRVVKRTARNIVGVFRRGGNFTFVVPDNKRIHRDIYIPARHTMKAKEGEKVVAVLTTWEDQYHNPEGKIIERLGFPGDPGVDMATVIRSFNLPEEFPSNILNQAEKAAARLTQQELIRREDFTDQCVYTIDPETAKDHDDAISVEKITGGYRLSVHIADVAYYVEPDTELDSEAFERGNSVYLPGTVIPMLPEALSNDVCSLRPNRKRLAHSCIIDFDKRGQTKSWRLADTVIKSRAKLHYEEVQRFFDSGKASERIKRVADNLTLARQLAKLLHRRRFAEGSLDFDLPEPEIVLDTQGKVISLGRKTRLEAHRLVEEFMLAANRAVALEVFRGGQQFIYRVHDRPDMEKLQSFSLMMKRLGHSFPVSPQIKPVAFARFLERIQETLEADFINELMLRSMQKAVYQRKNIGHFGLAFTHYTHFTSPIRRYPDLLVHRLLRQLKNGRYPVAFAKRVGSVIDNVGSHCSETERNAEAAERQAIKVKQIGYMAGHVGDEFEGMITGVTPYGFYVRLDEMSVEGMMRVSAIDDDYYHFDQERYRLIGRRSGRTFRLGDRIKVGVLRVDTEMSEMDLFIAKKPESKKKPKQKQKPKPATINKTKKTKKRKRRV